MVTVRPGMPDVPRSDASRAQQSFDLSMKNSRLQRIVAAELEVHGTSNKSRVVPAGPAVLTDKPTADAVRNVHVVSSVPADETRTRTVSVKDLTSVAWISVIELRLNAKGEGEGRVSLVGKVAPDASAKIVTLESYDALPAVFHNVRIRAGETTARKP